MFTWQPDQDLNPEPALEPQHDFRFTIEPKRKAWNLNPHGREAARFSKPARRAVSGYLPYSVDSPRIELGFPPRQDGVVPLDHEPVQIQWTGRGIEPRSPRCKRGIFPLDEPPIYQRSVWKLNPVFRLTKAVYSRSTYRPKCLRVALTPKGIEPSLSWMSALCLRRWTTRSVVSDRGGRRTHRITRLSTSSLCQFAYPVRRCDESRSFYDLAGKSQSRFSGSAQSARLRLE